MKIMAYLIWALAPFSRWLPLALSDIAMVGHGGVLQGVTALGSIVLETLILEMREGL